MKVLANENFPRQAVEALRQAGHDVVWVRTESPGITDEQVLARAVAERRVLLTFDKDFGELAYRAGLPADCGVILFRMSMPSPEEAADRIDAVIASRDDWVGRFAVVEDVRVRIRSLPGASHEDTP